MGQGYSLTTLSAGAAGIDVPELADLTYEKSLGNARFMKTIRARHKDGLVVAKVVMKPFNMQLDEYVAGLLHERKLLADVPNALPYHRIMETSTNGFLIRQYMHSSLYDRMSTRPFLESIEKKWLAFQLLCAVRDCHARNVYHGDIKTENILVTSWNWLYLSDFSSSFKPTYLPEDNPADFSFFFDTSGRRTCYLAPERFLSTNSQVDASTKVNWAMDIFSVGCVIAELFLETPIFSLSQLFKYRSEEYDPFMTHLQKIEDVDIREMVSHMIKLDPNQRYSADECLSFWRNRAFPDYFSSFLHQYMYSITDPSAGRGPITAGAENLGEADDRIDKVYNDFDKISYFLGYPDDKEHQKLPSSKFTLRGNLFPLHIDIPNYRHQANSTHHTVDDGTLIFLTLVAASVRSTARATARIRACELLLAFAEHVTDEAKLDRILPYLTVLLTDKTDLVRVSALRTLTQILALVSVVSPINAYVFPEYILPRLEPFLPGHKSNPNPLLRATFASCLATLATTASRFLDMMQALRADGSLPTNDPEAEEDSMSRSSYQTLYDISREDLVAKFEAQTKALLTDNDPSVRRAFLGSVSSLCVFFGSAKANDVILSHLNTYLNDRDWMLKCAFFETIVGVGTYVGGASLEEFILPLMVQALTDPEEFVVDRVLRSLSSMAQLGLFQRARIWELVDITARLTMHPNIWIREAAAQFVSSATTYLSVADIHSIVLPLINPYLKVVPSDLSELKMLDSLKKPVSRLVLDMAYTWATNTGKGVFWKSAQQQRTFAFGLSDDAIPSISGRELGPKALAKIPKNEEDEQWLKKLRNAGMGADDEFKLLALREYIWRVSHRKRQNPTDVPQVQFNTIVPLKDLGITPQTIFFDHKQSLFEDVIAERAAIHNAPHTITDALRDASTDDNIPRRPMTHVNTHLERQGTAERPIPRSDPQMPSSSSPSQTPTDGPNMRGIQIPKTRKMDSEALDSPASVTSRAESRLGTHEHTMRHRSSAMSLMNKTDGGNKALAEISTTSANAFGRVDSLSTPKDEVPERAKSPLALAQEQHRQEPNKIKFQAAHSYTGTDPTILKLLDSVYLENFPVDFAEFGPIVTPVSKRQPIKRGNGQTSSSTWRPEGTLIAMLGEHTGAISRVLVSPDHAFFITGSDDGTVKVWDSSRLERNVSHKSRGTYKQGDGVKITSLCFIENTHCFISTGNDGSVHVVKVDYNEVQNSSGGSAGIRYGKLKVMREHKLPQGQFAVWSHHYKSENQSVLLLATNTSQVHALDLRTMITLFTLSNPLHHGAPTCFVTDRKHHWLLLGTTHGVLDLWDLRFKMRLRAWCFPGGAPIHRITIQTVKMSRKPKFIIAGGTAAADITVWDLEKLICISALRTSVFKETSTNRHYTLIDLDDDLHQRGGAGGSNSHGPSGMLLGRFAASIESSSVGHGGGTDRSVRAVALGSDDGNDFLVSAGSDWKVRFWDLARPEVSNVVSGLEMEESRPVYTVQPPAAPNPETTIVQERIFRPSQQGTIQESNGDSSKGKGAANAKNGGNSAKKGRETTATRGGRDTLRSLQQQQLLKGHLDNVADVAVLEQPYGMVVSVDRAGVIMVFQ